jgi:hypothetical protein
MAEGTAPAWGEAIAGQRAHDILARDGFAE